MAVNVFTTEPKALLDAIKAAIARQDVITWSVDSEGDFTHKPEQWRNQAWLRPKVLEDRLTFHILAPRDTQMSSAVYAVYHGRFIEMLLGHFDTEFARASATSLPTQGDVIKG